MDVLADRSERTKSEMIAMAQLRRVHLLVHLRFATGEHKQEMEKEISDLRKTIDKAKSRA
jgi:hypothetical protein